jgi:hypothetical protein
MDLRSVQICGDAGGILLAHRVSSSVNLRSTAMSDRSRFGKICENPNSVALKTHKVRGRAHTPGRNPSVFSSAKSLCRPPL